MSVLERFRALAGGRAPVEAGCGVVTAADEGFFPGLQILWAGCQDHVPLAVIDLGLSAAQRAWCADRMQLLQMPPLVVPPTVPRWQAWNKACYLRVRPFERTLWLDSDCFVVGDLRPLFTRIGQGPMGVVQPFKVHTWVNKEELYQRYPVPTRISPERTITNGVLGFGQDPRSCALLSAWEGITAEVGKDPALQDWFGWWDEGALHWAVEKLEYADLVGEERGWHRFCFVPGRGGPDAFLSRLKIRPGDVVLHTMIRPKPWRDWGVLDAPPL